MSPELLGMLVLFVGVPVNIIVTLMLFRHSHRNAHLRVLKERFITATCLLFALVVFGLIFVNNDQLVPPINEDATKLITRGTMLLVGLVPAIYWLMLWYRGRKKR